MVFGTRGCVKQGVSRRPEDLIDTKLEEPEEENICINDQIDICFYNSRTYLMVFSYNLGIDLIVSQII